MNVGPLLHDVQFLIFALFPPTFMPSIVMATSIQLDQDHREQKKVISYTFYIPPSISPWRDHSFPVSPHCKSTLFSLSEVIVFNGNELFFFFFSFFLLFYYSLCLLLYPPISFLILILSSHLLLIPIMCAFRLFASSSLSLPLSLSVCLFVLLSACLTSVFVSVFCCAAHSFTSLPICPH